ncbi:AGAP000431-PA-like protein [Anopheles sinensis]|uniref:AGAP000431-PA-like protein n=1 Tax=Anopheles sinensis TaxID=74873 RepID=A0A084VLH8_ANOSI|nr:AGAP000431-PA-like protein [Anopheles sinensis]
MTLFLDLSTGPKRQRISTETDHDTESESSPSSPRHKSSLFSLPLDKRSPSRNGPPSSPESDLDVDSTPDESIAPENLSLKKDSTGYTKPAALAPVEIVCYPIPKNSVFPNRRRNEVELLLQRYRGDVVQAMEAMLCGDDTLHSPISVPTPSPSFAVKSAFSPLMPSGTLSSATMRYSFLQQAHTKRFLSAPYAGTGYLPTILQDPDQQSPDQQPGVLGPSIVGPGADSCLTPTNNSSCVDGSE